jgi:aldose 1-epimerase
MSCALRPQPGYEWRLDLEVTYAVDDAGLSVMMQAANAGVERAPFGVGCHPYLTVGGPSVDGLELMVPATRHLAANGPGAAPSLQPVAGTALDFTRQRGIGTTQLDTAFGELTRDDEGRAVARLSDPDNGRSVELWVDESFRYLMVYTGDRVARAERRRTAVAIEPMTCPPNALRTGADLVELDPGEIWRGSWGLRPGRSRNH